MKRPKNFGRKLVQLTALNILNILGINLDVLKLEDFCKIPIVVLKFLGFEWDEENTENMTRKQKFWRILRKIYFGICVGILLITQCLYAAFLIIHRDDPRMILRTTPNVCNNMFLFYRFMIICMNRRKLKIFLRLNNEVLPKNCNDQDIHNVRKYHKMLVRREIINAVICIVPIILAVLDFIISYIKNGTEHFRVEIYIPFDHTKGINYLIACLLMLYTACLSTSTLFVGDWILYSFLIILSMNFDIVGRRFKIILNNSNVQIDDVKRVVYQHVKLIEASNLLGSIFSSVLLINFTYGSFIMCLMCFQLVVLSDPTQFLIYMAMLALITCQIYLLCYHGQKLIDSSTNICNEIYDSNWYSIKDLRVKRMIIRIMQISSRNKKMSAMGYVDICHATFTTVNY